MMARTLCRAVVCSAAISIASAQVVTGGLPFGGGSGGSSGPAFSYYVSQSTGSDSNPGTKTQPFQTISKVNSLSLTPGQSVGFKSGDTWREQLNASAGGSSGSPITFGAYGAGAHPIINGSTVLSGWAAANLTTYSAGVTPDHLGNTTSQEIQTNKWIAPITTCINSVSITGFRSGSSPTGNVFAVVYSDSAGTPSTLLGQGGNIALSTITTSTSGQTITSTFSPCVSATAGTTYYVGFGEDWTPGTSFLNLLATNGTIVAPFSGNWKFTPWSGISNTLNMVIALSSSTSTLWQTTATPPSGEQLRVLLFDGAYGYRQTSLSGLTSQYDWYWSSGTVYVYAASSPSTLYTAPGIEAPARDYGISLGGHSYITINGIDATTANTSGIELIYTGASAAVTGITLENLTSHFNGYFGVHGNTSGFALSSVTMSAVSTDHDGGSGSSLNANSGLASNCTYQNSTSYRDGILGAIFDEGDQNLWWSSGLHWFGLAGGSRFLNNTISYAGVRDDGVIPNGSTSHVKGDGLWCDTCRATSSTQNVFSGNTVSNGGEYGLFNEKGAWNIWTYNVSYGNLGSGLRTDMDTGNTNYIHDNLFANNTVYGNDNGIFTEGDYACNVTGSNFNNTWLNNLTVGNTPGTQFTAQCGGANEPPEGSGNIYQYNGFGVQSAGFVLYGFATYNTYLAWFSDYPLGTFTGTITADPMFVNPGSADFSLQPGSPAINTGTCITGVTPCPTNIGAK